MSPFIKICGITRREDILTCIENGIDCVGFVLAQKTFRSLKLDRLEELTRDLPREIIKVGVTLDQDLGFIAEAVKAGCLDAIQLHGNESENYALKIDFCDVWKAVSLNTENDIVKYRDYPAKILIADSRQGGSGQCCDWNLAALLAQERDILLAGGITPDNALSALKATHAFGIDLSSGVEIQKGIKSKALIQKLAARLKNAF